MNETTEVPLIDAALVQRLVTAQFPQWAGLPIIPVEHQGWDNRTFRLGPDLAVRLPSAARYQAQIDKEPPAHRAAPWPGAPSFTQTLSSRLDNHSVELGAPKARRSAGQTVGSGGIPSKRS